MSEKDNQKVYFGDKKVSKDIKKDGVEEIFTKVSDNYDLMNDMMSVGMHSDRHHVIHQVIVIRYFGKNLFYAIFFYVFRNFFISEIYFLIIFFAHIVLLC